MIISYNKNYRPKGEGPDWELFSDVGFKDTLIISKLESIALEHKDKSFDDVVAILRGYYKNKTERSSARLISYKGGFEVIKRGVFPRFYIQKKSKL